MAFILPVSDSTQHDDTTTTWECKLTLYAVARHMSSTVSLPGLPREILCHLFRHTDSDIDAICLALTCEALYVAYVSTGALKTLNFGARVATFNALRVRCVTAEVAWRVLRDSGSGPPGYESDNSDMGDDWGGDPDEDYETEESIDPA